MSVCAKFKECAAKKKKNWGGGFLMEAYFSLLHCWWLLAHGCKNWALDWKFKIDSRIDTILMCGMYGDDLISSLDLGFIVENVPLND